MSKEYCPECGHLLPNSLSECQYCSWTNDDAVQELLSRDIFPDDIMVHSLSEYPELASTAALF